MTEAEAQAWLAGYVPRETVERLQSLIDLVCLEANAQNLVAASTLPHIWARHIVDSAQLALHAPTQGRWLDLGSGAGFPGLVIAIIGRHEVVLAESRARRVAFLRDAVYRLGLGDHTQVHGGRIERMRGASFDIISARAFAPLSRLFEASVHLATPATKWVLPKGRSAQAELDAARGSWQGNFRIVQSITDPEAAIIVADQVRARDGGGRKAGSAQ